MSPSMPLTTQGNPPPQTAKTITAEIFVSGPVCPCPIYHFLPYYKLQSNFVPNKLDPNPCLCPCQHNYLPDARPFLTTAATTALFFRPATPSSPKSPDGVATAGMGSHRPLSPDPPTLPQQINSGSVPHHRSPRSRHPGLRSAGSRRRPTSVADVVCSGRARAFVTFRDRTRVPNRDRSAPFPRLHRRRCLGRPSTSALRR
ncbi:putative proline-rich receptor-like protein kinase PERK13 [Iris pallida]|uniref:Proline-rich receptor-like protein kinase PERK13 n=1 Tax=Iris pallida TaxID=29817 RepID=A0AAX6ICM6_IRIPA|nr:putative proline-rich receptor-like protein kinase PERK13 [Iris pallida]